MGGWEDGHLPVVVKKFRFHKIEYISEQALKKESSIKYNINNFPRIVWIS